MKHSSFCENCGQPIEVNDKFCDACGFNLLTDSANIEKLSNKSKLKFPFFSIILIATLINGYFLIEKHYNLENTLKYQKKANIKLEKKLDNL